MIDVETIVSRVYELALCSESRPPGPVVLLRHMIGSDRIKFVDDRTSVRGLPDRPFVRVRRGLHGEELCMTFGRAAAVVALAQHCPGETLCEERVEPLTAALLMPGTALRACVRTIGPRHEEIARIFVVPAAVAAARLRRLGVALASGQYMRPTLVKDAG